MKLIKISNLNKTYITKTGVTYSALNNINLEFSDKGLVFITGKSGSGKSTMLNILGALDKSNSGEIVVGGNNLGKCSEGQLDDYRNTIIGFVFQERNLINTLSVYDNVKLSLDMQKRKDEKGKVRELLEKLGLGDKLKSNVMNLSGGQQQRVSIARALVKDPPIILADEPTGALDSNTSDEVFKIFKEISKERLVIVVTHDEEKALEYGDRIIELKDGKIYRDIMRQTGEEDFQEYKELSFISDNIVKLDNHDRFDSKSIQKLNSIIGQSSRKAYINVESNKNKMKALFPNLREAISLDNQNEEVEEQKGFVAYCQKDKEETPNIVLKKASLPVRHTLKFSLNNLKYKLFKLIITLLMTIFAFGLFGFSFILSSFNEKEAYADTIDETNIKNISINDPFRAEMNVDNFDEFMKDKNMLYAYQYSYPINVLENSINQFRMLAGFTEVNDVTSLGFNMLAGTGQFNDSNTYNDIVISEPFAMELKKSKGVFTIEELIGQEISLSTGMYKIVGVIKTQGDFLEKNQYSSYQDTPEQATRDAQIFVKKGFKDNLISTITESPVCINLDINNLNSGKDGGKGNKVRIYFYTQEIKDVLKANPKMLEYSKITEGKATLSDKGIYISEDVMYQLGLCYDTYVDPSTEQISINAVNEDQNKKLSMFLDGSKGKNKQIYLSNDFAIEGYVPNYIEEFNKVNEYDMEFLQNSIILSESLREEILNSLFEIFSVSVGLQDNIDSNKFINDIYDNGYALNSSVVYEYSNIVEMLSMTSKALKVIALFFCVGTVILIFTYLNNSIKMTIKQIGIIRGLGGRRKDCFLIFVIEGLIITIFACLIATILIIALTPTINLGISNSLGYNCHIVNLNAKAFIVMPILALVVTLITVFISFFKLRKITPVEAIFGKH